MNRYFLLRHDDDAGAICEIGFPPISINTQLQLHPAIDLPQIETDFNFISEKRLLDITSSIVLYCIYRIFDIPLRNQRCTIVALQGFGQNFETDLREEEGA
jgi:hypothetical protein